MNKFRTGVIITSILFIIFGISIPFFTDVFVRGLLAISWMIGGLILMILLALSIILD